MSAKPCMQTLPSSIFCIRHSDLFLIKIRLKKRILYSTSETPWTGDQPWHKATTHIGQHTDIHTSSEIRIHDPNVWADEDILYFRPRGHCDHRLSIYGQELEEVWVQDSEENDLRRKQQEKGENYVMRGLVMCIFSKYYLTDGVKENDMGGVRYTHGNEKYA
jgi:hypothetical protein